MYFEDGLLRQFLDDKLGLRGPRGKETLIDYIVKQERFHPNLIFEWLDRDDMRDLCEDLRLKTHGSKKERWRRVLQAVNEFNLKYGKLSEDLESKNVKREVNSFTKDEMLIITWLKDNYKEIGIIVGIIASAITILVGLITILGLL